MHLTPTTTKDQHPSRTAIQKTYFLIFNEKVFTHSNIRKINLRNLPWPNSNSIRSSITTLRVHYSHCERIKNWGRTKTSIWQIKTNWLKWLSTSKCWTLAGPPKQDRKFSWSRLTYREFLYTTQVNWNSQVLTKSSDHNKRLKWEKSHIWPI